MKSIFGLILAGSLMTVVACSSKDKQSADAAPQSDHMTSEAVYTPAAQAATVAGITFYPHTDWTDLGPSGMRKAEFAYGPIEGEADSATLTVYYFGPEQGGGVEANLQRWVGQMTLAEGVEPSRVDETVNGMPLHLIDVKGTYNVSSGMMMGGPTTAKEGYLMSAAVLEGPEGSVFFKLTGPEKTAGKMAGVFKKMMRKVEKAG
jgi:hypothetical protein